MDKSGVKYVILGYNQTQISEKTGDLNLKYLILLRTFLETFYIETFIYFSIVATFLSSTMSNYVSM